MRRMLVDGVMPLLVALVIVATRTDDFVHAAKNKYGGDWRELYQAGRLIFTSDAVKLYHATPEEETAWRHEKGETIGHLLYSPLMAVFIAPFALVSRETGFVLWRVLTVASMALIAGVLAASMRAWAWRLASFACVFGWAPILINLTLGQTGAFIAAVLAVIGLLVCRDREKGLFAAGAIALKVGHAIGPGLLAWEEGNKGLINFAVAFGVALLLPFVVFGPDAVTAFRG